MRFHKEARRSAYDAVIIGSGIGGLTAAALLARAGREVLVIERHDRVGGYAHAFRRGRRLFDSAVHLVGGDVIERVLSVLGVSDRCEFLPVEPIYRADFPDLQLRAPGGLDGFVEAHIREFPDQERGIRGLIQECKDIREEIRQAELLGSAVEALTTPHRFPTLSHHRRATLAQVMDAHIDNGRLRSVLATLWPYLGLPPSRVSFLYWATMLLSYVDDGAFYCKGSFQRFARALTRAIESNGGECLLRSSVRRIQVKDGVASGVTLENGQQIDAPVVISGADLRQTIFELVGREHFPNRYVESVSRMTASVSAYVVYAATSHDLASAGVEHENFFYSGYDHDAAYTGAIHGEPSWFSATIPTLIDPSLAPEGEHLVMLTTLIAGKDGAQWKTLKPHYDDWLLGQAEERLPGLRAGLTMAEGASPRTMERYTRNEGGALYGFDVSPAQVGPGRPDQATPLSGLYLAGHWTRPGGGVAGVVTSGVQAARKILGAETDAELLTHGFLS